ncbi:MAG: ABC transporter permease [Gaiellales bacterium]
MTARYRSVALGVAWRNLHIYFTNRSLFIPGIMFPLFFFVAFAGGLSAAANIPGFEFPKGYTAFQYVFVFLQSAAFSGVFNGFSIARDFESGFGRRMMLAAPRRSAILAGYVLGAIGRWIFSAVIITAVALASGMEVGGSRVDLFGLVVLALLLNLAGCFWAAGIALRVRTIQAGPAMQTPVFLLLFLAPVYVPLDLLAGWIHAIATVNPITYILEAGRGLISGDPVWVGLAFALALASAGLLLLWALRGMRKAEQAG